MIAVGRRFTMPCARVGHDEDACTRESGPPAQVEVFGAGIGLGVEAAELHEQVGAHEHHRGGHVEHVTDAVVLLLVDLARFDAGEGRTEAVDATADLEQDLGVLGADELRPRDAGVGAVPLLDHEPHRRLVEHDVVVAEEQEGGALDDVEGLVGGHGEPGVGAEGAHERPWEHRGHARGEVLLRAGVDHEHGEVVVVLAGQAVERVLEPGTRVPGDDHRDDGRVLGEDLLDLPLRGDRLDVGRAEVGELGELVERRVRGGVEGARRLVPGRPHDGRVGRFGHAHERRQRTVVPLSHRGHGGRRRPARSGGWRRAQPGTVSGSAGTLDR